MKEPRRRIDVNLEELDRVLDGARQAPLSESDHDKLQRRAACTGGDAGADAQHREDQCRGWEAGRLCKTGTAAGYQHDLRPLDTAAMEQKRLAARERVEIKHQTLTHGDRCPECGQGNVYGQKEPKVLVRDRRSGAAGGYGLLAGTVALRRLRAGVHGTGAGRRGRRISTTKRRRR